MDIRVGEKVSGIVKHIGDDGFLVALPDEVQGFAPKDKLTNEVEASEITEGSEVEVRVEEKASREGCLFRLAVTKLFPMDKFQKKPDKYLKNFSSDEKNGSNGREEVGAGEEFEEWLDEADKTLKKIEKHRKERLKEDFWTI